MLQGCTQEEGLLPDELMQGLKAMLNKELDDTLAYLRNPGYIYSIMDKGHFLTTDT